MKNKHINVKHVKLIREKLESFYLEVIVDACVKIAALKICFEKKTKESVVGISKNVFTLEVHADTQKMLL